MLATLVAFRVLWETRHTSALFVRRALATEARLAYRTFVTRQALERLEAADAS